MGYGTIPETTRSLFIPSSCSKGLQTPLLPWGPMLPAATSGWLPKLVPDTCFSCVKSPQHIASNPLNRRSVRSARRYSLSCFHRLSKTLSSCPTMILTSPMIDQRKLFRFVGNICTSLARAVRSVLRTDAWTLGTTPGTPSPATPQAALASAESAKR